MTIVKSMRLEKEVVEYYDKLAEQHQSLGAKASAIMAFDLKEMMLKRQEQECHESKSMAG